MFQPGATTVTIKTLLDEIDEASQLHAIEGITLVGGEPLEQLEPIAILCRQVQAKGLGVLLFTGYTLKQAQALPGFAQLARSVDTFVDGRFQANNLEPDPADGGRRFLGSSNQKLIHCTSRYANPSLWQGPNLAEIHVDPRGNVSVIGFPTQVDRAVQALRAAPSS